MEIIRYTEEHRMFRASVRKYLEKEVIPHVEEWEEAGITPRSAWKKLGDQGFLCTSVPEEYGGAGADFLYSVIMAEEMGRTNHWGLCTVLHSDIVTPYITAYGSGETRRKYLPGCVSGDLIAAVAMTEPNTGSDLSAIRTTATDDGDHVVINGQKTFISNGINCGICVVAVRDPAVENPYQAMDLYVVEEGTPGFKKGKKIRKAGWHSQDTAELYFEDCRVPKANRLGEKGSGFLHLMENLQQERIMCAIGAQALAEHIFDLTAAYCRERTAFGRPISKFQHSQFELVDMATDLRLGRTFLDKLIVEHMEGNKVVVEVSMAKFWITEMAFRVADRCVQLHGGYGYCDEYPVSRAWRDLRVTRIFAGSNEIMRQIVAKFMGL